MRVEWVSEPRALAYLREPWGRLVQDEATPFCDHEWFTCWWGSFGVGSELGVCAVWDDEDLVGVAPLRRSRTRLASLTNYHTPLFRFPARDERALRTLVEAVLAATPRTLYLHAVPATDPVLGLLVQDPRRIPSSEPVHTSPIVTTTGELSEWERTRTKSWRTVSQTRRRLLRTHDASFRLVTDSDDLDELLDRGFAIEASGWKGRTGTAISSSRETESFYRGLAHAYRRRGELRLAWLNVDGNDVAFNFCLERSGRLFLLKTGFDDAAHAFSPGLVLSLMLVEHCFANGLAAYELLGEDEPWKRIFATGSRSHVRAWSYARDPGGLVEYAARHTAVPVLRRGRSVLHRGAAAVQRLHRHAERAV